MVKTEIVFNAFSGILQNLESTRQMQALDREMDANTGRW